MTTPRLELKLHSDMPKGPPVSLQAASGQIVHIWGPSGVGKSTLLARIWGSRSIGQGLLQLDIDGQRLDLDNMPPARLGLIRPRLMAYVGQNTRVLPRIRMNDWLDSCPQAQLQAGLEQLDLALGLLQRSASDLSGGELQRFALLRAFCSSAPIVLLDEPCAGLDRDRYQRVVLLFRKAKEAQRLVIYTSHSSTSWADQEIALSE